MQHIEYKSLAKMLVFKVRICRVIERAQNGSDRVISVTERVFCAAGRVCNLAVITIRV
jgi:hypothetical protein